MTVLIVVVTLSVDLGILLVPAVVVAVADRGVSRAARAVIAVVAFALAWLVGAVSDATRAPAWTVAVGAAVVVVTVVTAAATIHRWASDGDGGASGPGPGEDHGGGGAPRCRPNDPGCGAGGSEPSWWPEFERQFGLYVAEPSRAPSVTQRGSTDNVR